MNCYLCNSELGLRKRNKDGKLWCAKCYVKDLYHADPEFRKRRGASTLAWYYRNHEKECKKRNERYKQRCEAKKICILKP